jgi:hypothetical protein
LSSPLRIRKRAAQALNDRFVPEADFSGDLTSDVMCLRWWTNFDGLIITALYGVAKAVIVSVP